MEVISSSQFLLQYYAMGLGSNQHNLTLSADPTTNTGPFIDVDAITVYSTSGGSSNQTASEPPTPQQPQRQVKHVLKHVLSLMNFPKQRSETFQNEPEHHDWHHSRLCFGFFVVASTCFLLGALETAAAKTGRDAFPFDAYASFPTTRCVRIRSVDPAKRNTQAIPELNDQFLQ